MKTHWYITIAIFLLIVAFDEAFETVNNRPIIGILSQEYWEDRNSTAPNGSYIAASYVKAVESAGARVVPIFIGKDLPYYQHLVNSVNGILLPGGGVDFWASGGYGEAAKTLYELSLKANQNGTNFPLYGVCLGFEALASVSGKMSKDVLEDIQGTNNVVLSLDFKADYYKGYLFVRTPKQILRLLRTKKLTSNHHSKCFTEESLKDHNLTDTWRVLSTSRVKPDGKQFISAMEHVRYPQIFGTQFHPEKPAFEWKKSNVDDHSIESLMVNRWFMDYFLAQARRNLNKFPDESEEKSSLIYNFDPIYTAGDNVNFQSFYTGFEQIYRFENH